MEHHKKTGLILWGLGLFSTLYSAFAYASPKKTLPLKKGRDRMTPSQRVKMTEMVLLRANQIAKEVTPNVPIDLVAAIITIESNFNPDSVNLSPRAKERGGAWGLMQVTLETAMDYANRFKDEGQKLWPKFNGTGDSLKDIATNLGFGIFYLSRALQDFDGDWLKAGVSYHQGKGTIRRLVDMYGDQWHSFLKPLGARYYQLLKQKRDAFSGKRDAVASLYEPGTGGGGGGDVLPPTIGKA